MEWRRIALRLLWRRNWCEGMESNHHRPASPLGLSSVSSVTASSVTRKRSQPKRRFSACRLSLPDRGTNQLCYPCDKMAECGGFAPPLAKMPDRSFPSWCLTGLGQHSKVNSPFVRPAPGVANRHRNGRTQPMCSDALDCYGESGGLLRCCPLCPQASSAFKAATGAGR